MQSNEATKLFYLLPSTQNQYPPHFPPNFSSFHLNNTLSNPLYNLNQMLNHPQPCFSSSYSTSDDAEDQQLTELSIINERKKRRMISNRESARRSRMRKLKHLDELWSQVVYLRNENHQLMDKLNDASERHDRVVQENAQLKEEASELRQMLADMQIASPNYDNLGDPDYLGCNIGLSDY